VFIAKRWKTNRKSSMVLRHRAKPPAIVIDRQASQRIISLENI
jgi:hypothetical protein